MNNKENCCTKLSYKLAILLSKNPNVNVNKNNIFKQFNTCIALKKLKYNNCQVYESTVIKHV